MKTAMALGGTAVVLAGVLVAAPVQAQRVDGNGRGGLDHRPAMSGRPFVARPGAVRQIDFRLQGPRGAANPAGPRQSTIAPNHSVPPNHGHFPGHGHPPGHGHFPGRGGFGGYPVVSYWPGYVDSGSGYAEPSYDAPPYAYQPATSIAMAPPPAPPAPPSPTVIEHPTGRYELRGDGLSVPYTWVWVPKPPTAPPPPPAPAAPPAPERPAARSSLYTWTDKEGVVHWTDNAGSVPQEYRAKVQKRSL